MLPPSAARALFERAVSSSSPPGHEGKQTSETARSQDEADVLLRPFLLGQINGHIRTETSQYSGIEKIDAVKAVQARTRWRGFSSIGQCQASDGWRAQGGY
jgi:hypothetical protein